MEVKLNGSVDFSVAQNAAPARPAGGAATELTRAPQDSAEFQVSPALADLAPAEDVSAEAVARGRTLIGDVKYPPAETIDKIANLLALHMIGEK